MLPGNNFQTQADQLSETAKAIHGFLWSQADHEVPVSQALIAKELGIGIATVQRNIKKLTQVGLVMAIKGRHANTYKVTRSLDQVTRSLDHSITRSLKPIYTHTESFREEIPGVGTTEVDRDSSLQGTSVDDSSSVLTSSSDLSSSVDRSSVSGSFGLGVLRTPQSDPPQVSSGTKLTCFSLEIRQYVSWFEFLVTETAKRSITDRRRIAWIGSTIDLLLAKKIDLAELVAVTDFIFEECDGLLPFSVYVGERKVTRVNQLAFHWDEIREAMRLGLTDYEETQEAAMVDLRSPLADELAERRVRHLTDLWRATRRFPHLVSDFDLDWWRREFRQLLVVDELPYDDLSTVVTALGDLMLELDRSRYPSPAHLTGNEGEWENVRTMVEIAHKRRDLAERQMAVASSKRRDHDDGDSEKMAKPPGPLRPKRPVTFIDEPWELRRERLRQQRRSS